MATKSVIPWEVGSIFVCTNCGAKFNEPKLAYDVKTEVRKYQRSEDSSTKIRVIPSSCLGVCYPERQTIAYMPIDGKTEIFTTELKKEVIVEEVKQLLDKKIKG